MRKIFELHGLVSLDGIDIVNKKLKDLDKDLKTISKNMVKTGESFQKIGSGLTKFFTVPLGIAGVAVTKFGADFQKSMTTSLSIMGDVSDDMKKKMGDTAKAVSEEMTPSASEAAKAYFYLASAGKDAAQSIALLPKVAKFATAGQFDLSLATDLLTDAQSALGLTSKNVAEDEMGLVRVSDVLVKANTLANASVQQFSESLTNRAGSALKILGKDIEEGVAVLAAYADQGVKSSEAGTQLSIVLRDLQKASIDNRGEFVKNKIAVYDANGEMRNMGDILSDLEKALAGMSDEQKKATLSSLGFQEKSVASLLTLIGTSDAIKGYEKELRKAAGTTDEVANKQIKNFWDQLTILRNRLVNIAITLSETLLPILENHLIPLAEKVVKNIKYMADGFTSLSPEIKESRLKFLGFIALLGPLVFALGKVLVIIGSVRKQMLLLNAAFFANPIGLTVIAVVALYNALVWVGKELGFINKEFSLLKTMLKGNIILLRLIAGQSLDTIRTINEVQQALKEGGELGLTRLTGALSDVNAKIEEQQSKVDGLNKKYGLLMAGSDIYKKKYGKIIDDQKRELQDLVEQKTLIKDALQELVDKPTDGPGTEGSGGNIETVTGGTSAISSGGEDEYKKLKAESDARIKMWDEELKVIQQKKVLGKEAETALFKQQDDESNNYKLQWEEQLKVVQQKKVDDKLKAIELEKQQQRSLYATIIDSVQQLGNVVAGFYENKAIRIDNDYNKQKLAIENSKVSEKQKNKLIEELDTQTAKKKRELARKSAMAEKVSAIFSIGINTARGIMNAFATLPAPASFAMAAIIGVLGAVQTGIVAAKPIPAAKGIYAPAQSGGVITQVAEGRENEVVFPLQTGVKAMVEELIKQSAPVASSNRYTQQQSAKPGNTYHMHIGTLIADDQGLMELERRMSRMSVTEAQRMGAE